MQNIQTLTLGALFCVVVCLPVFADEPSYPEKKPPLDNSNRGASSSELPWSVRLQILSRIVEAPKLLYHVESMEVYNDGVWVIYSVTNLSWKRKYVTPMFLNFPVGHMQAWDDRNQRWQIPQFKGYVQFKNPDTYISIEPF